MTHTGGCIALSWQVRVCSYRSMASLSAHFTESGMCECKISVRLSTTALKPTELRLGLILNVLMGVFIMVNTDHIGTGLINCLSTVPRLLYYYLVSSIDQSEWSFDLNNCA